MSSEIKRRRQAAYRKGFADGVASVAITDKPSPGNQTITGETARGERCELPPPPSTHMRGERLTQFLYRILRDHPEIDVSNHISETAHEPARFSLQDMKQCARRYSEQLLTPLPQTNTTGMESDPDTLRGYCQQLLDMFENYGVDIEDEDNDLIAHISKAVDPAHVESATTTEGQP